MTGRESGLVVYHADWGRSCRAIWLLRELQVPFTLKVVDWFKIKDKQFMDHISPLGRIPVLFDDGDVHIYESGAMVEYLLEKYSKGPLTVPCGTPQRAEYLQWFNTAETVGMRSVAKLYLYKVIPDSNPKKTPELLQQGVDGTKAYLQDLEDYLSTRHKGDWVCGSQLTAADIMLSYTLGLMTYSTAGPYTSAPQVLKASDYPVLTAYWERMQSLSGYQDCYGDINLLPMGEYSIEPGMSFQGKGTRRPTTF
ncbi:hypothetical protein WJX84_003577 [Apatococcus fuscideae]|uniref:Glutathione S-transferase n=1 Tax=Apatococcus fuscideae TaxID=2026836 RepID=A0AAW1T3B4_9CHLO